MENQSQTSITEVKSESYMEIPLFVKYRGTTPFGLVENFDKDNNYQGTSMSINCEDQYLEKAQELDQFFIDAFYKYKWSLNKSVPKAAIEGYQHGESGLWKRIS